MADEENSKKISIISVLRFLGNLKNDEFSIANRNFDHTPVST